MCPNTIVLDTDNIPNFILLECAIRVLENEQKDMPFNEHNLKQSMATNESGDEGDEKIWKHNRNSNYVLTTSKYNKRW